jgi:uncharacterized protein (UPF0305 family)
LKLTAFVSATLEQLKTKNVDNNNDDEELIETIDELDQQTDGVLLDVDDLFEDCRLLTEHVSIYNCRLNYFCITIYLDCKT